ncbi:hypothetical protein [Tepidimicrobium xylanilyticum]|uniref:Uncharacterized protein n=1 Tax=Tepidimicrobium xylanilyticum TaxID=1123352 RepID=A0A1H2TZR4_9FIRM|nr:hypothetical protein [Tepidimicrobium xylanilyticum]GMG98066.1 hypothetical protein EN5CB1_28920 [Tepidimicrobium xylanilyticum]SDW49465.1 hypothetical protein SAMN05660923_00853 [Tepidimicrobium xylanilyticum]
MVKISEPNEELDASKLSDEELKLRILKLNNDQLINIKYLSYYYLISNTSELIKLVENENILKKIDHPLEKDTLQKAFQIIVNSFENINNNMMEGERDGKLNILFDIRERLYSLKAALNLYEIEISYIKELVDHYMMKSVVKTEYGNMDLNGFEVDLLISKIKTALENTRDYNVFVAIVSNLISIMPFRMSKQKFFEVVKNTLLRNLSGLPKQIVVPQIEEYKTLFDSRLGGDYGILYDNYFVCIERLKNIELESKSKDELEMISKDVIELIEDIDRWNVFINNLGIILNRLFIVYLVKDDDVQKINVKEIFQKWIEYRDKGDENLLDHIKEICFKEMERLEKEMLGRAQELELLNRELIKRGKLLEDQDFNNKMIFTTKILNYYNDLKFTKLDLLMPDNYEITNINYLMQLIDNLIQYMNRSVITMQNLERKIRMRRFLSLLQLPFNNIEEFLHYINYSLDRKVTNKEEVLFSIDMANFILEKFSFKADNN